jgi:AcrR family transcriptional regulator
VRKTAAERREEILESALTEFAAHGYQGASTEAIAHRVGISQPYLFRLFGTKKQLFIAMIERCMVDELRRFNEASEGLTGPEALSAMGRAYVEMIATDPRRLRAQMQAYAASDDPEIAAAAREGFGRLVTHVEGLGLTPVEVSGFFARGMLINVVSSIGLPTHDLAWSTRLVAGCLGPQ